MAIRGLIFALLIQGNAANLATLGIVTFANQKVAANTVTQVIEDHGETEVEDQANLLSKEAAAIVQEDHGETEVEDQANLLIKEAAAIVQGNLLSKEADPFLRFVDSLHAAFFALMIDAAKTTGTVAAGGALIGATLYAGNWLLAKASKRMGMYPKKCTGGSHKGCANHAFDYWCTCAKCPPNLCDSDAGCHKDSETTCSGASEEVDKVDEAFVEKMWKSMGKARNEELTMDEMKFHATKAFKGLTEDKTDVLEKAFKQLDTDENGKLSFDEVMDASEVVEKAMHAAEASASLIEINEHDVEKSGEGARTTDAGDAVKDAKGAVDDAQRAAEDHGETEVEDQANLLSKEAAAIVQEANY